MHRLLLSCSLLISLNSLSTDPVMPGHAVKEAGRLSVDVSLHSAGLPWPPQLHCAQQAKGLSHHHHHHHQHVLSSKFTFFPKLKININISPASRFGRQHNKVFAPSSEAVISCSQTTLRPITPRQRPRPSSASRKWSRLEVKHCFIQLLCGF